MFEIVILGGGIAGLTIAEHCAKQTTKPILLLERYPNVGGRIVSNKEPYKYEIGAGRIHVQHHRVNALVKRFKLKTFPISAESNFEKTKNDFYDMFEPIRNVLQAAKQKDLQTKTIAEILPTELHPLLAMFPYNAEFTKLRADLALPLFANNENLGKEAEYYGIVGGMNQLTDGLRTALANTHVEIRTRHRVQDVKHTSTGLFEITGQKGKKVEQTPFTILAKKIVIATEYRSFKEFSVLQNTAFLKHLTDSPLLRIYAVYPTVAWFKGIPKTVTTNPIRHFIPINAETGLVMISYTEGEDTSFWRHKNDETLQQAIQAEVKKLFPDRVIPDPIYLKKHYWEQGCTYWKKGNYNIDEALLEAQNPAKNLYICGESVSKHQSWVESALESAEQLMLANRGL